ncbi:MAG: hypothetical protein HYS13_23775 [Planctomycetia bacterium]|nr:hypothetical protein [Planctomycetia bacterium]
MVRQISRQRGVWVAVGVAVGVVLGAALPHSPIHATASSERETFVICTGMVDSDGEAVFTLDSLTGSLRAWVFSPGAGFTYYQHEVLGDFGVQAGKGKFAMVTGLQQNRARVGGVPYANCVLYVAEQETGKLVAYGIPWNQAWRNRPPPAGTVGSFIKQGEAEIRKVIVRPD